MNETSYTREELWLLKEKYRGTPSPAFWEDCARLKEGEPLAYVIGHIPFLGASISLDSRPLIPRPETEYWVSLLIHSRTSPPTRILDLCAGSGAIGVVLAQAFPEAEVWASDYVPKHIETIRKNFAHNGVEGTVVESDLFTHIPGTFNIIATNPPYISDERMCALAPSVSRYEPHEALAGGVDGLSIIRRIIQEAPEHIADMGEIWMECDDEHSEEVASLFKEAGFTTHILEDQYGLPRVAVAQWKNHG